MPAKKYTGQRFRWKTACLGSLIMPGLGQLYAGSLFWALCWVFISCVADWGTAWAWVTPSISASVAKITALGCLGLWVLNALHAAWLAKRGKRLALPGWLRVTCYIGFVVVVAGAGLAQWYWVQSNWIYRYPHPLPYEAMAPKILDDRIVVNRSTFQNRAPLRGEIVVFDIARDKDGFHPVDVRPHAPRTTLICRVVGLPGDRIAMRRGLLYINQRPINTQNTGETYTSSDGRKLDIHHQVINSKMVSLVIDSEINRRGLPPEALERSRETPVQTIPPNRYFMLGDNRSYAIDSRYWGTVRREDLIGPAVRIYYPGKAHRATTRLDLVAQVIE